jgi:hemerythrin superfamily protein
MDVLTFLKDEHDEAKGVFKKLQKAHGAEAQRLWDQLSSMLSLHEEMEEKFFYPRLKELPRTQDLVLEGYQEHHVMDLLIGEIGQIKPSDEVWEPKIKVLQESTEHHIEEEEEDLFPKVRKVWDASVREEVGRQMEEMKAQQPQKSPARGLS